MRHLMNQIAMDILAGISSSRKISFHIWSLAAFSRMGESSDIKFEAMIK